MQQATTLLSKWERWEKKTSGHFSGHARFGSWTLFLLWNLGLNVWKWSWNSFAFGCSSFLLLQKLNLLSDLKFSFLLIKWITFVVSRACYFIARAMLSFILWAVKCLVVQEILSKVCDGVEQFCVMRICMWGNGCQARKLITSLAWCSPTQCVCISGSTTWQLRSKKLRLARSSSLFSFSIIAPRCWFELPVVWGGSCQPELPYRSQLHIELLLKSSLSHNVAESGCYVVHVLLWDWFLCSCAAVFLCVANKCLREQADVVVRSYCCSDCCVLSKLGLEMGRKVVLNNMTRRDGMTCVEKKNDLRGQVQVVLLQNYMRVSSSSCSDVFNF
jgi:hypothetical protein